MADNLKRKCLKCGRSPGTDSQIKLYRFPNPGPTNALRCELWAKYCFPDGAWASIAFQRKLYTEHRMLCNKHFLKAAFTNYLDKKLNRHAVPEAEEIEREEVSQMTNESPQNILPEPVPGPLPLMDITNVQKEHSYCAVRPGTSHSDLVNPSHTLKDITNVQEHSYCAVRPGTSHSDLVNPSHTLKDITNVQHFQTVGNIAIQTQAPETTIIKTSPILLDINNIEKEHCYCAVRPETSHSDQTLKDITNVPTISIPNVSTGKTRKQDNPLYKKCRKYLKKICQLKNTIKKAKTKASLDVLNENYNVQKLMENLSPSFAVILQGEIKNAKRKIKGRRWTTEEKILALRLYKRSAACYRLLRRMWCLPAPSTLKALLSQFDLNIGLNDKVFDGLKRFSKNQAPEDSEFVLMFDEMSIKKHLWYNNKLDQIDGYQDHGLHGRSPVEATHALVFMVSGVRKKVKQPVAFYLSSSYVTADRQAILIKEVLRKCFENNIKISATVCDMGGVNRRALIILGATKESPYFKFGDNEVVTIFDAPHLLKCFRNMLLKYNLKCGSDISSNDVAGQGIAKWKHIEDFFEVDNRSPLQSFGTNTKFPNFVFAPKLRKDHLAPNNKQKMRVNLAAQVLSHSVACGMFARISQGLLPADATVTAEVISNMDKLFDCVNGDTADLKNGKPFLTNMTDTSPHIDHFNKMKMFFETSQFIGCQSSPPSKQGWIWTINGIIKLYKNLKKKYGLKGLSTRRLQQDPLENLFGTIRGNCGANDNPTTSQFVAGLKTAILSNLAHLGAGNCEKDNDTVMIDFKKIFCNNESYKNSNSTLHQPDTSKQFVSDMLTLMESSFEESISDTEELQACAYVSGFLLKNMISDCKICDMLLKSKNHDDYLYNFVNFKEYDDIKKRLKYASEDLVKCVENCATMCNNFFLMSSYSLNLKKNVLEILTQNVNFTFLEKCKKHYKNNVDFIANSVFHITVKRFCVLKNRQFADTSKGLKRKIDILQNK